MKKIVPFSNTLKFNTDVSEITAISLEHKIDKEKDSISGVFYISGEYKIMDGSLDNAPFKFDLPFDIALGTNYNLDTLEVDVDDFRYELINNNELKVDIELYLDGEEIREEPIVEEEINKEPVMEKMRESDVEDNLLNEMLVDDKENVIDNNEYVTYRVYRVKEGDTIDNIISKYEITKDDLMDYNENIDSIKPGDKLIIQSKK